MPPSTRKVERRDEARVVAGEERDRRRQLLGLGEAADGHVHEAALRRAPDPWRTAPAAAGVFTGPGQSALTRMPCRANCTPSSRVIASTPPFDAVYEICDVAEPSTATNDAVLMIEPRCRPAPCAAARRASRGRRLSG